MTNLNFPSLFKKYRLRSEIETLAEFGDLLAQEGIVYENSIFTRWQNGDRAPNDRDTILKMITVFIKKGGISSLSEANSIMDAIGMSYLTEEEITYLPQIATSSPKLLQASLGGLIKDYRTQKGISQLEVAFALGWPDASKLEAIEQGKVEKPDRELINRICLVMGLKEQEKNQLLLAGNYLPTEDEIIEVRKEVKDLLNSWKYPVVVLDFSLRIIAENYSNEAIYNFPPEIKKMIYESHPTILEVQFGPISNNLKFLPENEQKNWKKMIKYLLSHYKNAQQGRIKEKWYIDHLKSLMQNKKFRDLWKETNLDQTKSIVTKYGRKSFPIFLKNKIEKLNLDYFVVPLIRDPRFEIEFHTPVDNATFSYFNLKNNL